MRRAEAFAVLALVMAVRSEAAPPGETVVADVDLAAFTTKTPWRFVARQAPPMPDPLGLAETVPGLVTLCLQHARSCDPAVRRSVTGDEGPFAEAHELAYVRTVRPCGPARPPLLILQTRSLPGGNGDQAVLTQALAYDRAGDRFARVFARQVGHNNNQEVRFLERGRLAGAFVTAVPTQDAPFAYWITVETPDAAYRYHQAARFRSRVRYGDGDPRAVIDAEMSAILRSMAGRRVCSAVPPSTNH